MPRLEAATAALGIQLIYKVIPGAVEGSTKGGLIEIEETLSTAARCAVMAHELLHKENREGTTRQQREVEAESVNFAVLAHCGIHSEIRFYLASYDLTPEMRTASLQTITSERIINILMTTARRRTTRTKVPRPPLKPRG